jgi:hypothetical protein
VRPESKRCRYSNNAIATCHHLPYCLSDRDTAPRICDGCGSPYGNRRSDARIRHNPSVGQIRAKRIVNKIVYAKVLGVDEIGCNIVNETLTVFALQ